MLHKIITYTLYARTNLNGQVSIQDLKLIFAAHHGIQVDIARWFIHKLYLIKNDKHVISFEMLISFIIEKLELNLKAKDSEHHLKFKKFDYFITLFLMMELLEKDSQDVYRFKEYHPRRQRILHG